MTGTPDLELEGTSRLAVALSRAALRRGYNFACGARHTGLGAPRLTCRRDGAEVAVIRLEPDESLAAAIAEDAVRRVMTSWPCASSASAVVLAPAGGVTGPADAGPVDAVTVGHRWVVKHLGGHCLVRLLTAQHTRCWLASFSCETVCDDGCAGPRGPGIERLPSWIAEDTARVCEYAQDRGLGDDWRPLLLLGPPSHGPGRRVEALFAFTEAGYAHRLVGSLLAEAEA